jgi:hypothetical protein
MVKKRRTPHHCGEVYCKSCCDFKDLNHKCYMRPDIKKPKDRDFLFIFFDLETRQDESLLSDQDCKLHRVNLCVSQQYCYQCINGMACQNRTRVFKSDPVTQFMEYILLERNLKMSV